MSYFSKGEYVNYSSNGVCLIFDIGAPEFDKTADKDSYYILKPLADKSTTVFVPMKNQLLLSRMRKLLTKAEIDVLITSVGTDDVEWIDDRKKRADLFSEILRRNEPGELLSLVCCIHKKREALVALGGNRKLAFSDLDILERAERLLEGEFSFVLGISPLDVASYVREKLASND